MFFAVISSIDVAANGDEYDLVCDEGKEIVFKPSSGIPVCVKSSSVEKYVDRGYALPNPSQENLRIGLLFSTDGDYSTYGIESQFAALQAIDDFNEHLKSIDHEEFILIPEIVYLSTNPDYTLEQVKKLHADGVDVFIGPQTSAELAMMKPYVDSEELLVISTSSTSPSLAIEDSIYRLVPDDTNQGKLISRLLEGRDITTVFLIVRDDIWGNGLADVISESFSGNISQINYDPNDPLFEEQLQKLSDLVAAEESTENIAIGIISFGEISEFLLHATDYENLGDVKWFGTDSNANEKKIIENEKISSFAEQVSFKAIQFASDYDSPIHKDVESKLYLKLEYLPSTYAFAAYDAVWLLGLSMLDVESVDSTDIESTLVDTSQFYTGTLGDLTFNDAGDLVSDNYDVWFVQEGKWYKNPSNFVESVIDDFTEPEDSVLAEKTDETDLSQNIEDVKPVVVAEKFTAGEDNTILVVALIVGILIIAVFLVWKIKKPKIHLKNSDSVDKINPTPEPEPEPTCGAGTELVNGICQVIKTTEPTSKGGGCLIATAAYGTELAPQVQFLREIRDNTVMSTESGTSFMTGFNQLYYSFSPTIADMERENPMFQEAVRAFITPMVSTLSIMTLADSGSESEVLGLGLSVIMLNLGMYIAAPALIGVKSYKHFKSRK